MKITAFTQFHKELGAKMVEFAGYEMPIQFEGINIEHETVRKAIGLFDVSHMGEFWVEGPKAKDFVQKMTSNDVHALYDGKIQYSCFPNGKGGIVDDLLVYRIKEDKYLLVVNASNIEKDWKWVNDNNDMGAILTNASDNTAQLAVQGPLALKAMQKLTDAKVEDMEYYTWQYTTFAGVKDVLFSTTGYTGSGGCEIYCKPEDGAKIYKAVMEAGEEYGIKSIGLAARDTLRLESGFCLYGNDIDDTTAPIEAGLGWITKFTPENQFIDREINEKLKTEGVSRRLRGFELLERGVPRHHYKVVDAEDNEIGYVTSGTMAPSVGKAIGMAYVKKEFSKFDTEIFIKIRNKSVKAKIVRIPFK